MTIKCFLYCLGLASIQLKLPLLWVHIRNRNSLQIYGYGELSNEEDYLMGVKDRLEEWEHEEGCKISKPEPISSFFDIEGKTKTFFHITLASRVASIEKEGLRLREPAVFSQKAGFTCTGGIHLFPDLITTFAFIDELSERAKVKEPLALARVELPSDWPASEDPDIFDPMTIPTSIITYKPIPSAQVTFDIPRWDLKPEGRTLRESYRRK